MAIIGITGSIASGKSTFRDCLAPLLAARVFDADAIARKLLEEDPDVRAEVLREISPEAYFPGGPANRAEIRRIIYSDSAAKARLEAILHPRVRRIWLEGVAVAKEDGVHVIVDIPLLFETGAAPHFEFVLTVACSPEIQITRLAARGIDAVLAQKIIRAQVPVSEKISRSTQVVWNDGSIEALKDQAAHFAARFCGRN